MYARVIHSSKGKGHEQEENDTKKEAINHVLIPFQNRYIRYHLF